MADNSDPVAAYHKYRKFAKERPVDYARVCLGLELWSKQQKILKLITDPKVSCVSVASGNAVGKTYLSASIICQYLDTVNPGYAIISGSSWTGVRKTVWATLRKVVADAPVNLGGEMLSTEWRRGDLWGAFCVSPDEPENFSGFRTKHGALILVDEASKLSQEVHEAIMGLATAAGSKVIYLGNPLRPEGPFYETFGNPNWHNVKISSLEVVGLGIPGLADKDKINTMKRQWGEDSPQYQARVLGEFPSSTFDAVIRRAWIPRAIVPKPLRTWGDIKLGVDVARFGDDRTVLVVRDGRCVLSMESYPETSTTDTAGLTRQTAEKFGIKPSRTFIDDTGVGGGVTDMLWEDGFECTPVNFGEAATDDETFTNSKAELFWHVRRGFHENTEQQQYVPKMYSKILEEGEWVKYGHDRRGRIKIEPKEKLKKEHHKSPDHVDAYALTFAGEVGVMDAA